MTPIVKPKPAPSLRFCPMETGTTLTLFILRIQRGFRACGLNRKIVTKQVAKPDRIAPAERKKGSPGDASRDRHQPTIGRRAETPETGLRCGWSPGDRKRPERQPLNPALQTQGNARPTASPRKGFFLDQTLRRGGAPWPGPQGSQVGVDQATLSERRFGMGFFGLDR